MSWVLFTDRLDTNFGPLQLGSISPVPTAYSVQMSIPTFKSTYHYDGGAFDLTADFNSAPWDQITTRKITLTNGNYILITFDKTVYPSDPSTHYARWRVELFYANDDTTNIRIGSYTYANNTSFTYNMILAFLGYNSDNNAAGGFWATSYGGNPQSEQNWISLSSGSTGFAYKSDYENWVNGSIVPEYSWKAWDQINGNNGSYINNLTKIKDGSIGDFTAEVTGSASDFDRLSAQSDIWGIFQNMSYGEERIIAWSGNAYMTFKLTAESQMPSYVNFIFKFYTNQDSLLFTKSFLIRWTGTSSDVVIGFYLSFVYDNENQVAIFTPVLKHLDGSTYTWGYISMPDSLQMLNTWQWLNMSGAGIDERPYDTGTTDNGGDPEGDILTNDDMPNVNVPALSALQTGMLTVYVPDETELQNIATFLWSDNVIDNFKKYFNNFSDNLISLYVLPYKPSNLPVKAFKVGGLASTDPDLSSVEYITNRFVNIDMGEITIGGMWNSYLDFSPYTKFNIYLPGIGVQAIDADDLMAPLDKNKNFGAKLGSTIKLDYVMDLMTGILVAYIKVNGQIRYQFSGEIGYQIPLTGENYNNMVHAFTVAASGLVTTVASGGQTAPYALGAVAAAAINFNKPDVYRGGNLSGSASSMSYKHPYLIRRVPNKPKLVNQDKFTGFPTYKSGKLREFGGYTEVVEVHVEGFVCTEEERDEIIDLLKKGVIL